MTLTLAIIAGAVALWAAIATAIAVGIGRAITTADQRQQAAEQTPKLRLVS